MSLILDALRKSEAERRRGQMPDLHAELPPLVHATAPRRRAWPWWFAGLAVLMAATALTWSQWASRAASVSAVQTSDRHDPRTAMSKPPAPMARSAPAPSFALRPVAQPTPAPHDVRPAAPMASVETTPRTQAPAAIAPAARELPAAPSAAPLPAAPVALAATTPAPEALPAPTLPSLPDAGGTVRLADLSPGEREQLPALKISMHMWGATPAQRFAIIDGTRVAQGDRVGEAVVEEIAADGVVLNWHGRRLSLPLR